MTRASIKSLLLGGLAVAATLTGCNQQQPQASNHTLTTRAAVIANYKKPTPGEVQDFVRTIAPQLNRSKTTVRVVNRPYGKHIDLNGGYQNVLLARTNPDGTISQAGVDSTEQATKFLSATSAEPLAHTANRPVVR